MKIILGSASKGRQSVLKEMGYEFEIMPADIDEKAIRSEDPEKLTLMLARAKAATLLSKINQPALLITSDQVVLCNSQIYEKPENEEQGREYLRSYASNPAETVTAVVVTNTQSHKQIEAVGRAKIFFRSIPEKIIDNLIREGKVFSHAGGFSITNPILKDYIEKVEGEKESVIGLPRKLTERLIKEIIS